MSSVTSKLRDSCNACATSKIKCPKERPSCSRCEIRGVKCHYSFTKRPGRKPENGASRRPSSDIITVGDNNPKNIDSSTDSDRDGAHSVQGDKQNHRRARQPSVGALFWAQSPTPSTTLPGNAPTTINTSSVSEYFALTSATGSTAVGSPRTGNTPGPADTSDIFSMLGDINAFPDFDGFDPKLDKLLESDIESVFSMPLPDPTSNIQQPESDIISLLIPSSCNDFNIGLVDAPTIGETGALNASSVASTLSSSLLSWSAPVLSTSSTISSSSSSPSSKPSHPIIIGENATSGTLARTLDILKSLSSLQSSRTSSYSDLTTASDADTFARVVLEENQKSINAVSTILSSSACGEDSFLLVVLSMIVLKILERCDAAAHIQHEDETGRGWSSQLKSSAISRNMNQTHQRSLSGPSTGSSRYDADSRENSVAKLVLGELHRVQRLVNELSKEIKKQREGDGEDQIMRDIEKGPRALVTANTLAQLETDMRKSLRALSSEIIDRLRHR